MAKVEKFEDLIAWQKARKLTARIYWVTKREGFSRDFGLRDQIRKASVSIMSNVAEGFERNGSKEFRRFLSMSKASCAEVRSQLFVALDAEYIDRNEFDELYEGAKEVGRILGGLLVSINKKLN